VRTNFAHAGYTAIHHRLTLFHAGGDGCTLLHIENEACVRHAYASGVADKIGQ
jgi:hypothetical protein